MSRDRGSIMIADLVIGAAIVIVIASAAAAAGIVIDAGQSSREAARSAAVELARGHGPSPVLQRAGRLAPPGAEMTHRFANDTVIVRVESHAELPHPITGRHRLDVVAEVAVPLAPYRSR